MWAKLRTGSVFQISTARQVPFEIINRNNQLTNTWENKLKNRFWNAKVRTSWILNIKICEASFLKNEFHNKPDIIFFQKWDIEWLVALKKQLLTLFFLWKRTLMRLFCFFRKLNIGAKTFFLKWVQRVRFFKIENFMIFWFNSHLVTLSILFTTFFSIPALTNTAQKKFLNQTGTFAAQAIVLRLLSQEFWPLTSYSLFFHFEFCLNFINAKTSCYRRF